MIQYERRFNMKDYLRTSWFVKGAVLWLLVLMALVMADVARGSTSPPTPPGITINIPVGEQVNIICEGKLQRQKVLRSNISVIQCKEPQTEATATPRLVTSTPRPTKTQTSTPVPTNTQPAPSHTPRPTTTPAPTLTPQPPLPTVTPNNYPILPTPTPLAYP